MSCNDPCVKTLHDVGGGERGGFVDGGVSMANNPALQLFLVATLKGFPFRWPDLRDDLLTPEPALTYLRYDARLEPAFLTALGLTDLAPRAEPLREMSEAANRADLARIGETAAARDVLEGHLPRAFDPS